VDNLRAVTYGAGQLLTRPYSAIFYAYSFVGDRLLVTLCHHERARPAVIGEVHGADDWVDGVHGHAFGSQ
jgi:hypothetical protein